MSHKFLFIILFFLLTSCSFEKIDSDSSELRKIKVVIKDRQENSLKLRRYIDDAFGGDGVSKAKYLLEISYEIKKEGISILPDSRVSSFRGIIIGNYKLFDIERNQKIHSNELTAYSGYKSTNSAYSSYFANNKSVENSLKNLADLIRMDLSLFFKNSAINSATGKNEKL